MNKLEREREWEKEKYLEIPAGVNVIDLLVV